jgi:hypothetical protein
VINLTEEIRRFSEYESLRVTYQEKASDMMPNTLQAPSSVEQSRPISSDIVRKRALQRLYRRRTAVDDLIRSLENYQRSNRRSKQNGDETRGAERMEFSAARTFPSGSAR